MLNKDMQKVIILLLSLIIFCAEIQAQDFKSPHFQAKAIDNAYALSQKSHANSIKLSSNYEQAIFDSVQRSYGGYKDIQAQYDERDSKLSKAEKASVENTKRNAEIINDLMKGLK